MFAVSTYHLSLIVFEIKDEKSGDAVHQPTWSLLLKIEHMVKLQVFGNNSKTVSNIKNLTWEFVKKSKRTL
jgi:hypothetical protein